jgi:hypothetical protein
MPRSNYDSDSGFEPVRSSTGRTLGIPFAFASHSAADALVMALQVYRSRFKPPLKLQQPNVVVVAKAHDAA